MRSGFFPSAVTMQLRWDCSHKVTLGTVSNWRAGPACGIAAHTGDGLKPSLKWALTEQRPPALWLPHDTSSPTASLRLRMTKLGDGAGAWSEVAPDCGTHFNSMPRCQSRARFHTLQR